MNVIESSDGRDAVNRDLDEILARINEARKIPNTIRSAAGCFARNFRPPKRAIEFSKLPEINFPDFHSIEEIEQSFNCAIEAMLVAGHSEKEILKTAVTMNVCGYNIFEIKRFIDEIKQSERYVMLDALINHAQGYASTILDQLYVLVGSGYVITALTMFAKAYS